MSPTATSSGRPLAVDADLTLTVAGSPVQVRGYGDLVVVDAPDFRTAATMVRGGRQLLTPFGAALDRGDLTVDVRVDGGSVARLGPGVESGVVSRALGATPAKVSLGGVVLAGVDRLRRGR
ncbi:hypothetical protein ACFO0N_00420 [Halobium salinum]|uniref:Uncharacterized protein n=1 Tax=Halobium salinum TaxID=1364940 RepID=A0ABD5P684_9EURY|nr:hypothetical protein [Halobium salinum]